MSPINYNQPICNNVWFTGFPVNAAFTWWLSSSLLGAWQLWSRRQTRVGGGVSGDEESTDTQTNVSKRRGSLTVPVIVVLLVAVTVQVQVRAAGQVETETRQEVRRTCSFQTLSSLLHGTVAPRSWSPPSQKMTLFFFFFQLHRWKEIKNSEAVDWCNKSKHVWAGGYLHNSPEHTEGKKCDIKPKRDHIGDRSEHSSLIPPELLIISICCSTCLLLSQTLIHSVCLTCTFHLWSSFMDFL